MLVPLQVLLFIALRTLLAQVLIGVIQLQQYQVLPAHMMI